MIETRRRAYLDAMGFEVWVTRLPAAHGGRLGLDAGSGSLLLVCSSAAELGTAVAGDLVRALGGDPVCGWLDPEETEATESLESAIEGRLITQLVVFGAAASRCLFGTAVPDTVGTATVTIVPGLPELAASSGARRDLWTRLRSMRRSGGSGMAS